MNRLSALFFPEKYVHKRFQSLRAYKARLIRKANMPSIPVQDVLRELMPDIPGLIQDQMQVRIPDGIEQMLTFTRRLGLRM